MFWSYANHKHDHDRHQEILKKAFKYSSKAQNQREAASHFRAHSWQHPGNGKTREARACQPRGAAVNIWVSTKPFKVELAVTEQLAWKGVWHARSLPPKCRSWWWVQRSQTATKLQSISHFALPGHCMFWPMLRLSAIFLDILAQHRRGPARNSALVRSHKIIKSQHWEYNRNKLPAKYLMMAKNRYKCRYRSCLRCYST